MNITLSAEELVAITGYRRPSDQLTELHRRGFHRARRSRTTGEVILERVHYDAICAGSVTLNEPRVRPPQPKLRAATA